MDNHKIIISINTRTGEITSTVEGLKGADCTVASKWVDALGKVTSDQHTPEFYHEPEQSVILSDTDL